MAKKKEKSSKRKTPSDEVEVSGTCSVSQPLLHKSSTLFAPLIPCKCWLQEHANDMFITPFKRTKAQPCIARKGRWVPIAHMACTDGDGNHEIYRPRDSAFVVGNNEQQYVPGEPLCLVCGQASMGKGEDRGSDLLECEQCLGAVHLHCAGLSEAPEVNNCAEDLTECRVMPPPP